MGPSKNHWLRARNDCWLRPKRGGASLLTVGLLAVGLAGCEEQLSTVSLDPAVPGVTSVPGETPSDIKYYPSDEPHRLGVQRFNEGNYGLAQQYFQDAVERSPKDVNSWLGLAASYDRLSRFDLADTAYVHAARLAGQTTDLLNNEGYSYMLRGSLDKARGKFEAALRRDPTNITAQNNVALLDGSSRYIRRDEQ